MKLTFETLFNEPLIIKAVINRIEAQGRDNIFWKKYLDFEQTNARTFKTYFGTQTGVMLGSVIDKNGKKPLRSRKSVGSGYGEVAPLGDRYQMDNDRLDMLKVLVDKFNGTQSAQDMNTIVEYIVDDLRQCRLAPHKRMDKMVGDLRSKGTASVKVADNPKGIEMIDIALPVRKLTPAADDKASLITYLQQQIQLLAPAYGRFAAMEMSRATFNNRILKSGEFSSTYKMLLGGAELAMAGGLITEGMANQVFTGIGLPPIRIVEEYVVQQDETSVNTFADDRIALLRQDKIGKMKWHTPYEASDPVPGKSYTNLEGGMFISSQRTDEGRFMEYGCEWIPDINPDSLVIVDLDNLD